MNGIVLVDTSVWFLRKAGPELQELADGAPLTICPPIVQELYLLPLFIVRT